ncbi:Multicopper oxidase, variant 2 [Balamuthia mandrillaris]
MLDTNTSVSDCHGHHNEYHCPDTTNLHTHGLHVSPDEDNIDTYILPGQSLTYTYNINDDHLMGTHWYHAHYHGSTNLQVHGGLFGALLITPHESYDLPEDLAILYNSDDTALLLLNYFFFGDVPSLPGTVKNYIDVAEGYNNTNTIPLEFDNSASDLESFYTVNGLYQPTLDLEVNVTRLLRIVHASGFVPIMVGFTGPAGGQDCTIRLVARDGVFHETPYLDLNTIVLLQGTRADIAVRCTTAGMRTLALRPDDVADALLGTDDSFRQNILMRLNVEQTDSEPVELPTSQAPLPSYLDDLRSLETSEVVGGYLDEGYEIIMGVTTEGVYAINEVAFPGYGENEYLVEMCLNKVYEFHLGVPGSHSAARRHGQRQAIPKPPAHPWHQHINHFQIVDNGDDETGEYHRVGEWRDVASALYPDGIVIRSRPVDYPGEHIAHCHVLEHEDHGMMALLKVFAADAPECGGGEDGADDGDGSGASSIAFSTNALF